MKKLLIALSFVCLPAISSLAQDTDPYSIGYVFGQKLAVEHASYHLPKAKEDCASMWQILFGKFPDAPKNDRSMFNSGCVDGYKSAWDK